MARCHKCPRPGKCLAIFPEGGIFPGAPKLSKFKNGVFKLAIENNVPLVPITFLDNWHLMGDSHPLWDPAGPGVSRAIIHESIPTLELNEKDLISLRQECKEVIEAPLRQRFKRKFKEDGS